MVEDLDAASLRLRIVNGFWASGAGQSELGREFARRMRMHPTDSAAIVEIMRAEDRGEPLTPARLAERIGITSGAASIVVNRLEAAGHVVRVRGHADRRMVTLQSTAAVHAAGDAYFAPLRERLDAVMSDYTDDELALVARFVTATAATIEGHARSAVTTPIGVRPEVGTDDRQSGSPPATKSP